MKILVVHNSYQQRGGEDQVVDQEVELLRSHGQEVEVYSVSNHQIQGIAGKLRAATSTHYSKASKSHLRNRILKSRPDLVHVHNFFPILTPSIYEACLESGTPVVQTLHNYRTVCSNGLLMRQGKPCEVCITRSPYHGVRYRCYRQSAVATLPVARMIRHHRKAGTWECQVSRFITLTQFAKSKFIQAGFPANKIDIKPNFVPDPFDGSSNAMTHRPNHAPVALYVGRFSEEKGIRTLLRAWREADVELRMVGSGPLESEIRSAGLPNIKLVGRLDSKGVREEMQKAHFLILPSECYEGFPLVIAEAFASGLPVIATELGSMAEIVDEGESGLKFAPGSEEQLLNQVKKLTRSMNLLNSMSARARRIYEEKYTPKINAEQLLDIYKRALPRRTSGS